MATTASNPLPLLPPPPPPPTDPARAPVSASSAAVHTGKPNDAPRDVSGSASASVSALSADAVAGPASALISTAAAPAQPLQGTHPTLIMGTVAPADGRVRNPIPSKLKGKTDGMKGNFNVMHMSLANRGESQARYEAAKRSSESTALQAKLAETPYYVSHHRRANYARPRPAKAPEDPAPEPATPPFTPGPARPLTAPEVKSEQARLLTLLRSLPHAVVVDHICKALAFFGGIPDAPAPADGKFPDSLEANGTGNLFVGWVAEIFPDLNRPRRPPGPASPAAASAGPSRRPRGRPKGSKATKARRDKGLKKAAKTTAAETAQQSSGQPEVPEDSWVDVDEDTMDVNRDADAVERRVFDLLGTPPRGNDSAGAEITPATVSTSGFLSVNPETAGPGSTAKKRGRPKGSKNRPKAAETAQQTGQPTTQQTGRQAVEQPELAADASAAPMPDRVTTPGDPGDQVKRNAKPARPKVPKSKAKATNPPFQATPTVHQASGPPPHTSTSYIPPPTLPTPSLGSSAINAGQAPGISANVSKNGRTQLPGQPIVAPAAPATAPEERTAAPQVKASAISGAKRKRQSNKNPESMTNGYRDGSLAAKPAPVTDVRPLSMVANSHNSPVMDSNGTAVPQAKRPRKSTATKRQSVAGAADTAVVTTLPPGPESRQDKTPQQQNPAPLGHPTESAEAQYPMAARSDPSQLYTTGRPQPRQQAVPPSGPSTSLASTEGLAAQYERFTASMQNRQQSAQSNMNSRQQTQHRQQQQTAHSNTSPTPAQVSRPPQMTTTLSSQQPTRTSANNPNYYAQNQTPSYTVHQGSYQPNPRQQHGMTTNSPGTTIVSHVAHSPQFGAQSNNSPLIGAENTFRASPSMSVHANTSFAPRRTPSASPMDNPYRAAATAAHGVSAQSPHFGSSTQTPTSSHAGVGSFQSFSDPTYLEMQGLGPAAGHGGLSLGNSGTYALGSGNAQRTNSASTTASYPGNAMPNGGYDASTLGKNALNTTYRTQNRWS